MEITYKTQEEHFNAEWYRIYSLPLNSDDFDRYKGINPSIPASKKQLETLEKLGISCDETTTSLQAHASMRACAKAYPERYQAIKVQKTESTLEKYTVYENDKDLPVTYAQLIQLDVTGLRLFHSNTPLPTRGEMAKMMNDFQESNPIEYDRLCGQAMNRLNNAKRKSPSDKQLTVARKSGVDIEPGTSMFELGEKLHEHKLKSLEKKANANQVKIAPPVVGEPKPSVSATSPQIVNQSLEPDSTVIQQVQASDTSTNSQTKNKPLVAKQQFKSAPAALLGMEKKSALTDKMRDEIRSFLMTEQDKFSANKSVSVSAPEEKTQEISYSDFW